ncbi:MAG: hypothetical protein K2O44_06570 [Clostridia bacterium]|nr:hypothetical protein [Clostridia bacterium]
MKATKKIVGAACALVAAVALSAGSTFAWFSQSGTVTATGMNVKATTSKNLVISNASTGTWGSTAQSLNTGVFEMSPASTADGKTFFNVANPEKVDYDSGVAGEGAEFEASTPTAVTASTSTTDIHYVMEYTYWVKADAAEGTEYTDLYVNKIEVNGTTGATEDISKALRVSVTYGTATKIYAPVSGATTTYNGVTTAGTIDATNINTLTSAVTITTDMTAAATLGKVTTTATQVVIRVWYEGQDTNCTSANSINVEELSVAVSLTASGATTPST